MDSASQSQPVSGSVPLPVTEAERAAARFWLILHEAACVPEIKGPWLVARTREVLREFLAARPSAYIDVLTIEDGAPMVQRGPEALQMSDGRSMSVARRHNASTRAAHAERHVDWVLVPREPTEEMIAAAEASLDVWRKSLSRDEAMLRHYIPPPRKSHKFIASATPAEKHAIRWAAMLSASAPLRSDASDEGPGTHSNPLAQDGEGR